MGHLVVSLAAMYIIKYLILIKFAIFGYNFQSIKSIEFAINLCSLWGKGFLGRKKRKNFADSLRERAIKYIAREINFRLVLSFSWTGKGIVTLCEFDKKMKFMYYFFDCESAWKREILFRANKLSPLKVIRSKKYQCARGNSVYLFLPYI